MLGCLKPLGTYPREKRISTVKTNGEKLLGISLAMEKNVLVVNPYYGGLYGEAKPKRYLFMLQVYETKGRDFTS